MSLNEESKQALVVQSVKLLAGLGGRGMGDVEHQLCKKISP